MLKDPGESNKPCASVNCDAAYCSSQEALKDVTRGAPDKLKQHVMACPIGWHRGQLKLHRSTVDADVVAWIQELERLVGVPQEVAAVRTRLPRPYALESMARVSPRILK